MLNAESLMLKAYMHERSSRSRFGRVLVLNHPPATLVEPAARPRGARTDHVLVHVFVPKPKGHQEQTLDRDRSMAELECECSYRGVEGEKEIQRRWGACSQYPPCQDPS